MQGLLLLEILRESGEEIKHLLEEINEIKKAE